MRTSIGKKLLIAVLVPIIVSLAALGFFGVRTISRLTTERVQQHSLGLVQLQAEAIKGELEGWGRVVETMLANQQLVDFFIQLDERGLDLSENPELALITQTFTQINANPAIESSFFASNATGEYFKEDGRSTTVGYDARTKWWWDEALDYDRLFVQDPGRDQTTKALVITIQNTMRRDGQLIGVGGIDVESQTIGERLSSIHYEGRGFAFLTNNKGEVVYFPGVDLGVDTGDRAALELAGFDQEYKKEGADGFAELAENLKGQGIGFIDVRWKPLIGKNKQVTDYVVAYAPISSDSPEMRWSLGLMIPAELINGPVRQTMILTIVPSVAVVFGIALVIGVSTRKLVAEPVAALAERLRDIAEGEGDLTRRIEIASQDELGELATWFNTFVERIQGDVSALAEQSIRLSASSSELSALSQQIASSTESSSSQVMTISDAASRVSRSVQTAAAGTSEMNASIREIALRATEAAEVASSAVHISEATTSRFDILGESAHTIGTFVKVIESIAEQTNLLALNATIEAARAGDAGKGFAVVAAEVKELATQTGGATEEIREHIGQIQGHTTTAGEAINEVSSIIDRINEIQIIIASAVEEQSATTSEITRNVSQAATSSGQIAENLSSFAEAIRTSAQNANVVQQAAEELSSMADQMSRVVGRFSY